MQLSGFQHQGSAHWETGNLRNALTHVGVVAPHTGQPYSEAMLLGVGGGLGGAYFLCGGSAGKFLLISGRHHGTSVRSEFLEAAGRRLGAKVTVKEATSPKAALANLTAPLAAGLPVIAWVSRGLLRHQFLADRYAKMFTYTVLVHGFDEAAGVAHVSDTGATSLPVPAAELAAARDGICTHKNRTLVVEAPAAPPDLKAAIREGLRDCWQGLLEPKMGSLGLSGFEKWIDQIANSKSKDGWPRVLPGGLLFEVLRLLYYWVETSGTGGGNFRGLYADFLDEAAGVLPAEGLRDLAGQYRDLARAWTDLANAWSKLADAYLPSMLKPFRQARDLLVKMHELFQQKGAKGLKGMAKVHELLSTMGAGVEQDFPLDAAESLAVLEGLRDRLVHIVAAERRAAEELKRLAG
jgi:hypothetical protein